MSVRLNLAVMVVMAVMFTGTSASLAVQCDTLPARRLIDFDSVTTFQFQTGGANCWGWTAPDGRHYAIMGGYRSIGFVDLQTLTIVDTVPTQACTWRELKTYRNYCYAVSECEGDKQGMMIIDMRWLPDSVHYVGSYISGSNVRSHCISIDTARGYCYLVRQNYSGFRIVSLANPEAPVDVGGVTTGQLHDMTAFNDTVYAAEGNNHAFSIWNCTNKANPALLARVTIPGTGYVHNLWPTADRRFLASTEEVPDSQTMKIWNTEDLTNIYRVSQYLGPGGIPHNAHIEGNYLFLAHYSSGISLLDISYPECPIEMTRFDTYPANNNPDFVGCWGVYPHTDSSGWVYGSNLDGKFFIFRFTIHPFPASAEFSGAPLLGQVPLDVDFVSTGPDLTAWDWDFGDGGTASTQSPTHTYTAPGIFDVALDVSGLESSDSEAKPAYVMALAETLKVADTGFDRGTSVVWDVNFHNTQPVSQFKLPITLSNIPGSATFDSISYAGCRTNYFELKQTIYDGRSIGQIAVQLFANFGGPAVDLPPGDGPIARIYLTIKPGSTPGTTIDLTTPPIGVHALVAYTAGQGYSPISPQASALIGPPCDCSCHGDPICDGQFDIADVITAIGVAFRGTVDTVDPSCVHEGRTDVSCDGQTDVVDVILAIGVAFRGEDPAQNICNPCN